MKVRPLALCGAVAAVAALVTLAVALVPDLRFGYRDPSVRVAIETAATLIALVVAYIFIGRYLRSHRLDHLGVAVGLFTLALSNACTTVNVAVGPWEQLRDFAWGSSLAESSCSASQRSSRRPPSCARAARWWPRRSAPSCSPRRSPSRSTRSSR